MWPEIIDATNRNLDIDEQTSKEELQQVFGAVLASSGMSGGRRNLWVEEEGLFPAPKFGVRYGLKRHRFEHLLSSLKFSEIPQGGEGSNDKWAETYFDAASIID